MTQATARGWRVLAGRRRPSEGGLWVRLDWADESTWQPAFSGSDAAYMLVPFNDPGAAERTPDLLQAAAAAGVGRIALLTSWDVQGAPPDSPLRTSESVLTDLPLRSAFLRPTWFLDNFTTGSFAGMVASGELRLPAGLGRLPFIDVRDVAAVAVEALGPGGPEGPLHLTGPEQLDHHQVAAALGDALGRRVRYRSTASAEFVRAMVAAGFTADYGQFLADALVDLAEGRLKVPVTDTVRQVLGRPAHSLAEFAAYHAGLVARP